LTAILRWTRKTRSLAAWSIFFFSPPPINIYALERIFFFSQAETGSWRASRIMTPEELEKGRWQPLGYMYCTSKNLSAMASVSHHWARQWRGPQAKKRLILSLFYRDRESTPNCIGFSRKLLQRIVKILFWPDPMPRISYFLSNCGNFSTFRIIRGNLFVKY
jgi:hypothetical protein